MACDLQQRHERREDGAVAFDVEAEGGVEGHGEAEHDDAEDDREEEQVHRRHAHRLEDEVDLGAGRGAGGWSGEG